MNKKQKKNLVRILVTTAWLLAAGVITRLWDFPVVVLGIVYLIPYVVIGYDILRKAALGVRNRALFDENFLMAIATLGVWGIGIYHIILGDERPDFEESVAVMLFYQIGELFQSYAVGRSRKNISDLMDIRPDYANIETAEGICQVDPDEVNVGTILVVKPGEKIPIDGVIEEGSSTLNTSALTGESMPRDVACGDEVVSGCVNITGVLRIRTTAEFEESTVSKILELVENSSMKKSKSENFISRFARVYTPVVTIAAVLLALVPPLVNLLILHRSADFVNWIPRALNFLVISCPCALVISIPLSFFGGIGGASARGILVKGSVYLENLSKVKYMVFDKTGTLTQGKFKVSGCYPEAGVTETELLEYAAYAEYYSKHPVGACIKEAYGKELQPGRLTEVQEISGHGVQVKLDGKRISAGNLRMMELAEVSVPKGDSVGTVVHVAGEGTYLGSVRIEDAAKEGAREAIRALKKNGIRKTIMLTGDNKAVAERVAAELELDEVYSELLPADKVERVELLLGKVQQGEQLAFVGDGINDAPVLSRADIGIAMGALGSDAAIEAADVVLMDDDPRKIALAMKISRKTVRIVYENIIFALAVKFLCLALSAGMNLGMWIAILADVGVMILAVLNATRALGTKNIR